MTTSSGKSYKGDVALDSMSAIVIRVSGPQQTNNVPPSFAAPWPISLLARYNKTKRHPLAEGNTAVCLVHTGPLTSDH